MTPGFLGIDAGTQGLSVVFTDKQLKVIATGEGRYEMLPNLAEGCYEQNPSDWEAALAQAMESLKRQLPDGDLNVLGIGISGQMHGEVLADAAGNSLGPARLWCDGRNEDEGKELTQLLGVKVPKRMTVARWLWTLRNQSEKAESAVRITTPSGWLAYRLTGEWMLGIGDASGMFPIDQQIMDYAQDLLTRFDSVTPEGTLHFKDMLPKVKQVGQSGGQLNETGAALLGLPKGIPVSPAEGDQPASLAGSLIGQAGLVSVSFGTSVAANSVGDRTFDGVEDIVDHFCACDGKPINMVCLRNGTTFMNTVVDMFGGTEAEHDTRFERLMPQMLAAEADCGGLLALPFMDDEPGLGVSRGGTAQLIGINPDNATPGNAIKAALLSTMFNLRLGSEQLDQRGYPRHEIVLAGGITKTPGAGQILADVFETPVTLLESSEEGTAWGAALMACFGTRRVESPNLDWDAFLEQWKAKNSTRFEPDSDTAAIYRKAYTRYKALLQIESSVNSTLHDPSV